jgi:hypothetical protein
MDASIPTQTNIHRFSNQEAALEVPHLYQQHHFFREQDVQLFYHFFVISANGMTVTTFSSDLRLLDTITDDSLHRYMQ